MPRIVSLSVQNVRIHDSYHLDFQHATTVITGPNGSGKTSLLEALYVALRGSSFKGSDLDVLRAGSPWYRIDVSFDDGMQRTVKFDPSRQTGKKQFVVDNTTNYRLLQKHKQPVVLFEPDDLRLLGGSPARRREYFDRFISQIDPIYGTALRKYERALRQRNNLLKYDSFSQDELFAWDVALSEYGAKIIAGRTRCIDRINQELSATYNKIADSDDTVTVRYVAGEAGTKQKLLSELHANIHKDRLLGYTSSGPHRHDIAFIYNGTPALSVASRGEVRSIMLALKFIEVAIIEETLSCRPIILLDDVFSELDAARQGHLVQNFKDHQVVITSATSEAPGSHEIAPQS